MKRLLFGVGNRLSSDDGLGPAVAEALSGDAEWISIDCGTSLENVAGIVTRERPDLLVIVDAARMDLPPGSIRRLPPATTDRMLASTHGLPLSFIVSRLEDAATDVVLIGIEPEDLSFGEGLSAVGAAAVDRLRVILRGGGLDRIPAIDAESAPRKDDATR